MYIFRWLMSHPILTTWILTAIVILLTIGSGGHKDKDGSHVAGAESSHDAQAPAVVEDPGISGKHEDATHTEVHTAATEQTATGVMDRAQQAVAAEQAVQVKKPLEQQIPAAPLSDPAGQHAASAPETVSEGEVQQQTDQAVSQEEGASAPAETESKGVVASMKAAAGAASAAVGDVVEQAKNAVVSTAEKAKAAVTRTDPIQPAEAVEQVSGVVDATSAVQQASTKAPAAQETTQLTSAITSKPEQGLASLSSVELLAKARDAFWRDDKDKSAAIYEMLIEREPDSLVYKGELGNVLWHQNRQQESAALYADIAIPMLKAGKTREVSNMLGFIGAFYPEKASQIHQMMANP